MTKQHKAMNTQSEDLHELVKMQTEFALIESMLRSKTLSAMVLVGVVLFEAFGYFLYRMAGA
ncbi:hypothetical protein C6Y40_18665 [Alteromonas alba]|uniref:Uncharacterized protein n=1 Tax=Alteromonas alba TaxID=2079529 RepID=A0A2S9V6V5_9ALTE|nr:hypothetical protein [Alteromonas alba]PRO72200.1 hypothetical protein C6Y40_18665 [Alteromonas alba]|tara:strand:- start:657 stop:842 length:186 start_codon:yes stop_codon:yes gene_type:complete